MKCKCINVNACACSIPGAPARLTQTFGAKFNGNLGQFFNAQQTPNARVIPGVDSVTLEVDDVGGGAGDTEVAQISGGPLFDPTKNDFCYCVELQIDPNGVPIGVPGPGFLEMAVGLHRVGGPVPIDAIQSVAELSLDAANCPVVTPVDTIVLRGSGRTGTGFGPLCVLPVAPVGFHTFKVCGSLANQDYTVIVDGDIANALTIVPPVGAYATQAMIPVISLIRSAPGSGTGLTARLTVRDYCASWAPA